MQNVIAECIKQIRAIDYKQLDISDYNKTYIQNIFPYIDYVFTTYQHVLSVFSNHEKDNWIIDFGGGHGFLSLFLKKLGYKVIYCDFNPLSVQTITLIKEQLGFGPDYIVTGSSLELKTFCKEQSLTPALLVATDLIEHVYDLSVFFRDLYEINPHFEMVFTTGSNPDNTFKCRKLRKIMISDEKDFVNQRTEFIRREFPNIPDNEVKTLAIHTRGKIFSDVKQTVEQYLKTKQLPPLLKDPYNTCDPQKESWTERILPFEDYKQLANTSGFQIDFAPGFYNEQRNNPVKSYLFRSINMLIRNNKKFKYSLAPYIVLYLHP